MLHLLYLGNVFRNEARVYHPTLHAKKQPRPSILKQIVPLKDVVVFRVGVGIVGKAVENCIRGEALELDGSNMTVAYFHRNIRIARKQQRYDKQVDIA